MIPEAIRCRRTIATSKSQNRDSHANDSDILLQHIAIGATWPFW
jgi:hypothetical protein